MLFRFHHLNHKSFDTIFKNISRHHVKTLVSAAKSKRKVIKDEVEIKRKGIPIVTCKRASYNFYKGDTYNKRQPILASQGWNHRMSKGDHFFIHPYNITDNNEANQYVNTQQFEDLNLDSTLCSHLKNLSIEEPLEIQKLAIPTILEGHNTLVAAETGCGKTLAYVLPLITQVLKWKEMQPRSMNHPLGLIVTPSRELAVQIGLELIKLSNCLGIKTKMITGGRTKRMMIDPPVGDVDILVCSFGVISKLSTVKIYNFQFVRFVVLDEADALFHETFEEKLKVFMKRLPIGYHQETSKNEFPNAAQLILTSATDPSRLKNILGNIVNVESLQRVTTNRLHKILVLQKFVRLGASQKPVELLKFVKSKISKRERVIVFSNQNVTSNWVCKFLHDSGVEVTNLNGDMPLRVRRGKYGEFINGKTLVLSTTNGGARGLDTIMVNYVLNYDFPLDTSVYIHRCGRTGRVGTLGECRVTNFISKPGEIAVVQRIEKAARRMKPMPIFNLLESTNQELLEIENEPADEMIENLDDIEDVPY